MQEELLRYGQFVYCSRGEILGRVAAIGAQRFLVDTGDVAVWLRRACVAAIDPNSVTLTLAPSEVEEQPLASR